MASESNVDNRQIEGELDFAAFLPLALGCDQRSNRAIEEIKAKLGHIKQQSIASINPLWYKLRPK